MYNNIDLKAANLTVRSAARRANGVIEVTIDNTFSTTDSPEPVTRRVVYRLDENSPSNFRVVADITNSGFYGVYGLTPIMVSNVYADRTGNYCQSHQDKEIDALTETLTGFDFQQIEAICHTPEWINFKNQLSNELTAIGVCTYTSGLVIGANNTRYVLIDTKMRVIFFDTVPLITVLFDVDQCSCTIALIDGAVTQPKLLLSTLLGDKP